MLHKQVHRFRSSADNAGVCTRTWRVWADLVHAAVSIIVGSSIGAHNMCQLIPAHAADKAYKSRNALTGTLVRRQWEAALQHSYQAATATQRMAFGRMQHAATVLHDTPQLHAQWDTAQLRWHIWAYLARRRSLALFDKSTAAPPTLKMQPAGALASDPESPHLAHSRPTPRKEWRVTAVAGLLGVQLT